mmetsp:Transcript_20747/g.31992  ORF Transcript_20747/g.31992 Transcript_20747/m.31992 type:complete len:987 (-) Transcript_20747:91-3051(-)
MAIFHSLSAKSYHNRNLRLELLDIVLGDFGDLQDVRKFLISEEPNDLTHCLTGVVNDILNSGSINLIEWVIAPGVVALLPHLDDGPQVEVGFEVLLHLRNTLIVRNIFVLDKSLSVVDHLCIFVGFVDPLLDVFGHLSDFFELFNVAVLLEGGGQVLKLGDGGVEVLLVVLHLLDELFLLLLEEALLLLNAVNSLLGCSVHSPHFIVLLFIIEAMVELIESMIDLHAVLDLILLLLELLGEGLHELLDSREFFDVLGNTLNLDVRFLELFKDLVASSLGDLRDELDLLEGNLLVLGSEHVTDNLRRNLEDGADDLLWDLLLDSLLFVLMEDNTSSQLVDLRPVLRVLILSHLLIRVELVLLLESVVGLDVVLEGVDDAGDHVTQLVVLVENPSVLIGQLTLIFGIGVFRAEFRSEGSLQEHLGVGLEEMRQQLLLNLVDLLQGTNTVVEDSEDGRDNFLSSGAVLGSLVISKGQVDVEEGDLGLGSTHLFDLLFSVEHVLHIEGIRNCAVDWHEVADGVDESLHTDGGHVLKSILHDELSLRQELLESAHLVGLLGSLIERVPGAAELLGLQRVFGEVRLNDVLDLVHPRLLQVVRDLGGGRLLDLLELIDSHGLGDVRIVDILQEHIVTLLSDLLHSTDGLVLVQNGVEAEVGELLSEVVRRNDDHAVVGRFFLLLFLREDERAGDEVGAVLLQVLVEDDLVHGLGKVEVDLIEQRRRVRRRLASQLLGVLGHGENTVHLLVVDFRDLVGGHVLNIEVVLQEGVGHQASLVSDLEAASEVPGVFIVEQDVNPVESDLLLGVLPVALISFRGRQVLLNLQFSPEAKPVSVSPQPLGGQLLLHEFGGVARVGLSHAILEDRLLSLFSRFLLLRLNHHHILLIGSSSEESLGFKLLVIICLKRQPSTWSLAWISELNTLFEQQFFNVKLLEIHHFFLLCIQLARRSIKLLVGRAGSISSLLLSLLRRCLRAVRVKSGNRRCGSLLLEH